MQEYFFTLAFCISEYENAPLLTFCRVPPGKELFVTSNDSRRNKCLIITEQMRSELEYRSKLQTE